MKRLCLFLALLFIASYTNAQTWAWAWEKNGGGPAEEELGGQSVSDITGNTYVVGNFKSPTATFGTSVITLNGTRNMFVAKYNSLGNVMWARNPAAGNDNRAFAVAIDPNGTGIFVAGTYSAGSVTFGSFTLSNAAGGMYIVKYDNGGNVVWAHDAVATSSSAALSVAADAWGNCYVTGEYQGPSITFGSATLTNLGLDSFDIFLVKYNSTGNVVWAKSGGGTGIDGGDGVSVGSSGAGDVYVTGYFSSPTATFGAVTLSNGNNNLNTFIVKYDTSGNAIWARKSIGNTGRNGTWIAAAIDPSEDVYVSGSFTGTNVIFDTATLVNANAATLDAFLVQYDSSGTLKHAMRIGGSKDEVAGVTIDQNIVGTVFLTGFYDSDSLVIDTSTLRNIMTNGSTDIFIAGFDNLWNTFITKTIGSKLDDRATSCSSHGIGDMYVGGMFKGQYLAFGADTAENNAIDSTGDIFVAKLSIASGIHHLPGKHADVSIYPNPAQDILTIQVPASVRETKISLQNLAGQTMQLKELGSLQTRQLQLNGLAPGLYILKLELDGDLQYFKIMHRP